MSEKISTNNRPYKIALTDCVNECNKLILSLEKLIRSQEDDKNNSNNSEQVKRETINQVQASKKKIESYINIMQEEIKNHKHDDNNTSLMKDSIDKAQNLIKRLGEVERFSINNNTSLINACDDAIEMCDELLENCQDILG